eukprot:4087103-Amphidinium_carterae.1
MACLVPPVGRRLRRNRFRNIISDSCVSEASKSASSLDLAVQSQLLTHTTMQTLDDFDPVLSLEVRSYSDALRVTSTIRNYLLSESHMWKGAQPDSQLVLGLSS